MFMSLLTELGIKLNRIFYKYFTPKGAKQRF